MLKTLGLGLHRSSEPPHDGSASALGLALDATSDAFLLLDERGTVRIANAHAARMFGTSGESLVGRRFTSLLSASAAAVVRPLLEFAARGQRSSGDFPIGDGRDWCVAH